MLYNRMLISRSLIEHKVKMTNENLPNIVDSFIVKSETIISIWSVYKEFDVVSNTKNLNSQTSKFSEVSSRFKSMKCMQS